MRSHRLALARSTEQAARAYARQAIEAAAMFQQRTAPEVHALLVQELLELASLAIRVGTSRADVVEASTHPVIVPPTNKPTHGLAVLALRVEANKAGYKP